MTDHSTVIANGVVGYVTSTVGTVTNYIRKDALDTNVDIVGGTAVSEYKYIDTAAGNLTGGIVESVTVTNGGSKYSIPPTISFTGGAGTGAAAIAIVAGGVITAINITDVGHGYTGNPTVVITNATGDTTGSGATATAAYTASATLQAYLTDEFYPNGQNSWTRFSGYVQKYDSAGEFSTLNSQGVDSVTVLTGGTYSVLPTGVTITSADGNGTGATATVAGTGTSVTSVTITDTGYGYTSPPVIAFTGGTDTVAATAQANLGVPVYAAYSPAVAQALQKAVLQLLQQTDLRARND